MRFVLVLAFLICGTFQSRSAAAPLPNVVFMMADDMGMGDTSAYQDFTGNGDDVQIHTPAMERLARMGVRFTDAHTPSSRCSPTRYGLLTGRYPWRNRLKHWVLFGVQGDPMIEPDRPTLATLFRGSGYATAMVGKWHVGLRYRQTNGLPAAGWKDADLTRPLFDTPVDHGFDYARFTSRSHGTSGPDAGKNATTDNRPKKKKAGKKKGNGPGQSIGPGHIHDRVAVSASGDGKRLVETGPDAYVLTKLGGRHSNHAVEFLRNHVTGSESRGQPFFLYYPANSNHGPYTPNREIDGQPVAGAARSRAGEPMDTRYDFIYENDVALGRLMDWLAATDDPRRPGHKLIANTVVVFTSDNGAEKDSDIATGPFRSHKGSTYEGGHRVPFIVSWPVGGVGDGDASTPGQTSPALIGLIDMYATFSDVLDRKMPDWRAGEKGGEDSVSVLDAWRGKAMPNRPLFFHDHKEAKDHAASAIRLDDPVVGGRWFAGQWKLFFDSALLRKGEANPVELFDLGTDSRETINRLGDSELAPLVEHLTRQALLHRNAGGHRLAETAPTKRIVFDWLSDGDTNVGRDTFQAGLRARFDGKPVQGITVSPRVKGTPDVSMTFSAPSNGGRFAVNDRGLGVKGGSFEQVDDGEALLIRFDRDVLIESAAVVAGNGVTGGFYRVGDHAPLAIYCVDGDIDSNDQSGLLSDIGWLRKGEVLRLDSSPHLGVETAGRWRLAQLTVRVSDE